MKKKLLILLIAAIAVVSAARGQEADSITIKFTFFTHVDSLPVTQGQLLAIPGEGLFIIDNSIFYSLDSERCTDIVKFRLKDNIPFEQVIVSGESLLLKNRQYVFGFYGKAKTRLLTELDTETFFVFGGTAERFHVVVLEEDDSWGWYTCDTLTSQLQCVTRCEEPISLVWDAGEAYFCAIGNRLYIVTPEEFSLVAELPIDIIDGVITREGLFLCTPEAIYRYTGVSLETISTGQFHSMHYDCKILYVVMQTGEIYRTEI